jgi:hypothetical protein
MRDALGLRGIGSAESWDSQSRCLEPVQGIRGAGIERAAREGRAGVAQQPEGDAMRRMEASAQAGSTKEEPLGDVPISVGACEYLSTRLVSFYRKCGAAGVVGGGAGGGGARAKVGRYFGCLVPAATEGCTCIISPASTPLTIDGPSKCQTAVDSHPAPHCLPAVAYTPSPSCALHISLSDPPRHLPSHTASPRNPPKHRTSTTTAHTPPRATPSPAVHGGYSRCSCMSQATATMSALLTDRQAEEL